MDKQPLSERVADDIQEMIISQKYLVGERLANEFELAEELKVGRNTIREAIKLLASKNIVEIRRGKGTFVSERPGLIDDPLGLSFLSNQAFLSADLLEVRQIIEPAIAKLAARNRTSENIDDMLASCLAVEEAIALGKNHTEEDMLFHTAIAKGTQNQVIPNLIPIIHSSISAFIEETNNVLKQETITTHREILAAIKSGSEEQAEEAMKEHLRINAELIKAK
ncbi:FadR/GntR family transcriptional regulator [Vagococcus salmoninarum]|uniref:FadR/GntR family transcriptional regulator n=1 Tax=Vagococcus salmoninarum TaxID=2739 RepID=UPI001D15D8D5|nr:FadR/GntR family transcriptional regulator [Vagococcus salmoninarum]